MSFEFDSSSDPSLGGSNSDDYGIIMEENRLSSLEGLPQASWRSSPSLEQLQKETENSAMSWLTDDPLIRSLDSSVLRLLPSESQVFPWTFHRSALLDDDCISEEAVTSSVVEHNNNNNCNSRMFLGNQPVGKNFHFQTLADRVLNSIEKLRVFYERISDMARVEEDDGGYGDSDTLQQVKETTFSPPHSSVKVADSLPKLQTCENGRVAKLDASSETFRSGMPVVVAYEKNSYSHQQRQRMSQTMEESFKAEGGPVWGMELEGGDSNSKPSCCGVKKSGSKADLDDLLSSLRCLLFVLKNHEETEQVLRSKLQVLRGRKDALHLQKQQYKVIHNKRQRVSQC